MKRWLLWLLVAVAVLFWTKFFLFTEVFTTSSRNETNRQAILKLHNAIRTGDTREEVLRDYYTNRTDRLRLRCDKAEEWVITMPMEFGATDWQLQLEFGQDKVSSIRIRTTEGMKPGDSPDDKNTPNQEAAPAK